MDFRFVHAADLHLGSPFKGLEVDPRLLFLVQQATFRAFERIVDLCLSERAHLLVLAGDLFDHKDRSVKARLALSAGLGRLREAGVEVALVHGNHDPLEGRAPGLGLPTGVKAFGPGWEEVEFFCEGRPLCTVQGISYAQEAVRHSLVPEFRRPKEGFSIGVLHANVGAAGAHAAYAPCSYADLDQVGLDYWALGHVHTRGIQALPGGGMAVYPGNPQGRHVNEDGPRGCALVEVRAGCAKARFVDLEVVRWHRVELDTSQAGSLEELGELLQERLTVLGEQQGPLAHAARVVLVGRGAVHEELRRPAELEELEQAWRAQCAGLAPPWILESVIDATMPQLDLERVRREGGLLAAVLEGAEEPRLLLEDEELVKLQAALRAAKVDWSLEEEVGALAQEAAALVAERLWEEGG